MPPKFFDSTLPLKAFVQRAQTLQLYRDLLRSAAGEHGGAELKKKIRYQFEANRNVDDPAKLRLLFSEARSQANFLKQGSRGEEVVPPEGANELWGRTADPDDSLGRVGKGWPWQQ